METTPNVPSADRLVKDFDKLARKIASKYAGVIDFDDLYQIARMAIWEAPSTFDSKKGSLNTHLYKRALYAVLEYVKNEQGGVLRIPGDSGSSRENPRGPRPRVYGDISSIQEPPILDPGLKAAEQRSALETLCAAANLTSKQAVVIQMLFTDEMAFGEVVKKLGCTEQNLHYLRKTALDKIRAVAMVQGIDPVDLMS